MPPTLLALALLSQGVPVQILAPLEARAWHLRERLECPDPEIRLHVLGQLQSFRIRDSAHYPPLLRHLLGDPSPEVRWEALARLDEHGVTVRPEELPETIAVPLAGILELRDPASVERMRSRAREGDGWAILALGLVEDPGSVELALALGDAENPFVRHSAAVALLHLGCEEEARARLRSLAALPGGVRGGGRDPTAIADGGPAARAYWYNALAAERLVRLGETEFLGRLVELIPEPASPLLIGGILEDLTGTFRLTEAEWRAWWRERRGAETEPSSLPR